MRPGALLNARSQQSLPSPHSLPQAKSIAAQAANKVLAVAEDADAEVETKAVGSSNKVSGRVCACARVCAWAFAACARARVGVCVCVCARARVLACVRVYVFVYICIRVFVLGSMTVAFVPDI